MYICKMQKNHTECDIEIRTLSYASYICKIVTK